MKIFILDDCLIQLTTYSKVFPNATTFWQVSTFREALYCNKPDILICDLVMPDCTGWSVIEQTLEIYPDVKIIVATSHEGEEQKLLASLKGYGYWQKGQDLKSLRTLVANIWKTSKG